jgi:transcription elongation factor GreA
MPRRKATKNTNEDVLMVTQPGYDEMVAEIEERKGKRMEIAAEIDEARKLGDLSENEPYAVAMQKKEMNDARLDELEYLITIAQIVEGSDKSIAGIGSELEIRLKGASSSKLITLVGRQASQEADPREGKISIDSPLGSALNGSRKGDKVIVELPTGKAEYEVVKVA